MHAITVANSVGKIVGKTMATTLAVLAATAAIALAGGAAAQGSDGDSASVVRVSVVPARTSVLPGDVVPVAIIFDHERRWHTQAGGPDADAESIPTTVTITPSDERLHVRIDAVQWPLAERKPLRWAGPGASVAVYGGRAIVHVPVEIRPDAAPGVVAYTVTVGYQACDDRVCLEPVRGQSFSLQFAVQSPPRGDAPALAGYDHPEFFDGYRPVAPQFERVVRRGSGGAAGIPVWVHAGGAILLVAAAAVAIGGTVCAGMLGASAVLLLRLVAVGLAIGAASLWIGFAVAG